MRTAKRVARVRPGMTARCVGPRRRSSDVVGVFDSLTAAESAVHILSGRGVTALRISLVLPPAACAGAARGGAIRNGGVGRTGAADLIVLLHGTNGQTDRAREILADEAARAHDECRSLTD